MFGPSGETRTPGILLPKQARYQLRYTRIWNCFIYGLSCGLGRFLTSGFAELVPASGSVPAGCGVGLFPSWMGGICSQSKRATNCATPGYGIVLSVVFHVVTVVFGPTALRKWFPLLVVSQRVARLGISLIDGARALPNRHTVESRSPASLYREMVGVKAIDSYHFTVFSSDVKKFSVLQQLHHSSTA